MATLATYQCALNLIQRIDRDLQNGYHYHTKDGRTLFYFDQVLLALQENNLMFTHQIGILYKNDHHLELKHAIARALRNFLFAPHTYPFTPEEIHLNPADYDGSPIPKTLTLILDPEIKPGFIRVCTRAPQKAQA